jgi:hypothetical protein
MKIINKLLIIKLNPIKEIEDALLATLFKFISVKCSTQYTITDKIMKINFPKTAPKHVKNVING